MNKGCDLLVETYGWYPTIRPPRVSNSEYFSIYDDAFRPKLMTVTLLSEPLLLAYLLVFGVAALTCFVIVNLPCARAQQAHAPWTRDASPHECRMCDRSLFLVSDAGTRDCLVLRGVSYRIQRRRSMSVLLFRIYRSASPSKPHLTFNGGNLRVCQLSVYAPLYSCISASHLENSIDNL